MAITRPGKPIDLGYARKLAENYQKNKLGATLPATETNAVWFSKGTILSALGLDPGTDTGEITGLRIYLGAYENQENYPQSPNDRNKITLIVVQTGGEKIIINRSGVDEIAYLDIINDPTAQPNYPTGSPSPIAKTCFNDGQMNPPPDNAAGLGLMDWQ